MNPNVGADIVIGFSVPAITLGLYLADRINNKHLLIMLWGFAVGSTWEFANYYMGDSIHTMKVSWPMPLITLHLCHTFWDAGLFIIGYWLCLGLLKTATCCTQFRWSELLIMWLWGSGQGILVELMGNGVIWEYRVHAWNPVWLTLGGQDYTLYPQLIWAIAPVVFYLGLLRINAAYARKQTGMIYS